MPNVLIVMNEVTSLLVSPVAQAGYDVIESRGNGDTIREIMRTSPAVVILPDGAESQDGADLLPAVREMTRAVIVIVGDAREGRMAQVLLQGADAYWKQPVDAGKVSSLLRALLRRRREPRSTDGHRRPFVVGQKQPLRPYLTKQGPVDAMLVIVPLKVFLALVEA